MDDIITVAIGGVPFATTIVGVITAFGTLFTAVSLIIAAIGGLKRSQIVERKVDEVHIIVNQQRTDLQRYQVALISALQKAGVEIPIDQSLPIITDPEVASGKHQALGTEGQ
jgi:hypothetical protein